MPARRNRFIAPPHRPQPNKGSATYATRVTASFPICYMLHETRENTRSLK
jgi:hypothetical protein